VGANGIFASSKIVDMQRASRTLPNLNKLRVNPLRTFNNSAVDRMRIVEVPCRSDNYMYLLIDEATNKAAVIDPFDFKKIDAAASKEGKLQIEQLITTHHHQDHAGGNVEFVKNYKNVEVYGGSEECAALTKKIKHGDEFSVGQDIKVKAYATPCHTQDSICFFVEDKAKNQRGVFTGDTLFVGGCGRFFEGKPEEMHTALNKTLAGLPDDTVVYCGHEYTKDNVRFGAHIAPDNADVQKLKDFAEKNSVTTGKFTIGDEKKHNVFMSSGITAERVGELREQKNNFRG